MKRRKAQGLGKGILTCWTCHTLECTCQLQLSGSCAFCLLAVELLQTRWGNQGCLFCYSAEFLLQVMDQDLLSYIIRQGYIQTVLLLLFWVYCLFSGLVFKTGSHSVAQANPKLASALPLLRSRGEQPPPANPMILLWPVPIQKDLVGLKARTRACLHISRRRNVSSYVEGCQQLETMGDIETGEWVQLNDEPLPSLSSVTWVQPSSTNDQ